MTRVRELLASHERARDGCLPLVVSENSLHPEAAAALSSDLGGRYAHPFYAGSGPGAELIEHVRGLARDVFRVRHAFVEPLSGNVADLAVLFAFTHAGGSVAMVPRAARGYPLGAQWFERHRVDLPVDPDTLEFDVPNALEVAASADLTILGGSLIPFPHPVGAFAGRCRRLVFDGAHVLGLIATGAFQDPIREGAGVLIGSTHKSLPGPQGGLVLTDRDDLAEQLRWLLEVHDQHGIGLVDNPHPSRIAALGVTLELLRDRPDHGRGAVRNARTLAAALDDLGVAVRFKPRGFTKSHQVALDVAPEQAASWRDRLEAAGVFTDEWSRLGTAEVTWRGLGPSDMEEAAACIADVWDGTPAADVRPRVARIARRMAWPAP